MSNRILNTFDGFMYTFKNKHYVLCTDRKNKTDKIAENLLKYVLINATANTKERLENEIPNEFKMFVKQEKYFIDKWTVQVWENSHGEIKVDCKQGFSCMCNHKLNDFVFITINGGELKWYEV